MPESKEEADLILLKRAGGADLPPTLNELIALFALGERQGYLDPMYLSSEGANHLHGLIGNYLERKVLHSILLQAIKGTNEEIPSFIEKLQAQRVYDPNLHPEYLVFEALEGIRIHEGQRDNLTRLKEDPDALIHMIMGSGKSRVITPIWALMQAKYRDKLGVIVVPKPLYPTGKETAKDSIYKAFGNFGHPFEFSRKSSLDVDQLTMLNENLKRWKKEKGFIYTTKESLLSFMLFYEELFFKLEKATTAQKETLEKQIDLASKVLTFFKNDATALFDEVHSLLNIKEEVNFTMGQSEPLPFEEAEFTKEIVLDLLKIEELGLSEDRQAQLQDYDRIVKVPILKFLEKKFGDIDPRYFTEERLVEVKTHPQKNLIALGKELISRLLPFTLSKKVNEHFGLRADSNLAIPYAANNTPKADSEFGSPYETLLYTFYYYTNQPIRKSVIQEYLDVELEKGKKEMIKTHLSIDESSAGKLFFKSFGISLSSPNVLDELDRCVNASAKTRIDFMMLSLVSSIKTYKHKLSSNSQDLYRMFFSCQGMSGTPWNHTSFPVKLNPYVDQEVNTRSEQIIQKLQKTPIHTYEATTDETRLEAILASLANGNFHALIDCGALIKGVSNETMAYKILENPRFAGVVYYNDQDELLVLTREGIVPFDLCKIPPDQRFTFYDQRHTTGSDIKQAPQAKALLTFSETTVEYELYQSMWRMRGLEKEQSIELITSRSLGPATAQQILAKAKAAQEKRILLDNFRAQKAEVKAIALEAMRTALMSDSKLFPRFKQYLLTELPTTAFELFGEVNQEKDAKELLLEYKAYWKKILDSLKDALDATHYQNRIDGVNERPLPMTQPSRPVDAGAEVENELDQELDEARHVEQELELLQDLDRNQNPHPVYTRLSWNEEDSIFDSKKDNSLKAKVLRLHLKIKTILNRVLSFLRLSFRFKETVQPVVFRKLFPENLALNLSDVLQKSEKEAAHIFDENISISSNFLLPFQSKNLFSGIRKPLLHFVVMVDENQRAQTMIIDQTDLSYFQKKLKSDTGASLKRVCIYSPTLGVTSHGKKEITDEELIKNESFRKQLTQIKFFGGFSNFNQEESSYLEKWIQHKGPPLMWTLFNKLISKDKLKNEEFKQSSLSEIFKKLLNA